MCKVILQEKVKHHKLLHSCPMLNLYCYQSSSLFVRRITLRCTVQSRVCLFPQGGEAAPGTGSGKEDKKKKKAEDEENTLDWWSRYYATKATMEKVSIECEEWMGKRKEWWSHILGCSGVGGLGCGSLTKVPPDDPPHPLQGPRLKKCIW